MRVNRFREAFGENVNLVGLATAFAASCVLWNPLPLLAGLVAEAAYLLFVPDTKWYERRLAKKHDAEIEARRLKLKQQVIPTLRPALQERFERLEMTRRQIDTNTQADKAWFREVLRKLDYLLEKFLQFASKEAQFRAYLDSLWGELKQETQTSRKLSDFDLNGPRRTGRRNEEAPRRPLNTGAENSKPGAPLDPDDRWAQKRVEDIQEQYRQDLESLQNLIEKEPDDNTKAVLEKRADVLQRRSEYVAKIGRILTNINHQLHLLEDTFGLINDEIRARSPEQILADIEEVVVATNTMSSALEELGPYEQVTAGLSM
jgi:hypothetical protein